MMMVPKVSQSAVANVLGVTFQQIQKYEKGVNRLSAAMMVRIAEVLNVDVQSRAISVGDNSRPRASAVLRLWTKSSCSTGMSAGFEPLESFRLAQRVEIDLPRGSSQF
jgi:transcriptional regulator with XRE-family HTH domain